MHVGGSVLALTALTIIGTLVGVVDGAQLQFTQTAPIPTPQVSPSQLRRQPLFPVPRLEVTKAPQPPAEQADPVVPPSRPGTLPNLKPRVVCGMTLIPAPPSIDPKIAQKDDPQKPKNPTTYTIRPVQPSMRW
jgi:hypothetical protein